LSLNLEFMYRLNLAKAKWIKIMLKTIPSDAC
jgi:hypothetical protein